MMKSDSQTACLTIIVVAAVFALFYSVPHKAPTATQCSARKAVAATPPPAKQKPVEQHDDAAAGGAVSARYAVTSSDYTNDWSDSITDKAAFDTYFSSAASKSMTPGEITKAREALFAEGEYADPPLLGKNVGSVRAGTLAACRETKAPQTKKPTLDSMFFLPDYL